MVGKSVAMIGGGGYVGRHISTMLANCGWQVTVIDPDASRRNFPAISVEPTMVSKTEDFADLLSRHDHLIHLASATDVTSGARYGFGEVIGSAGLTEAMCHALAASSRKCTVTFVSSSAVYGDIEHAADEERDPPRPMSAYGASKAAAEMVISAYCATHRLDITVLRPASIVGGAMNRGVIPALVSQALNDQQVTYLGDGSQVRSYVHVATFAGSIKWALRRKRAGLEIFNIAGSGATSVKKTASMVTEAMGIAPARPSGAIAPAGEARIITPSVVKAVGAGWSQPPHSDTAAMRAIQDLIRLGLGAGLRDDEVLRGSWKDHARPGLP